jgi:hypothetical protein
MMRYSLDSESALSFLEGGRREGVFERVFRFATTRVLQDYENKWRSSLGELPPTVIDEEGESISVEGAQAVEVGYRRIGGPR